MTDESRAPLHRKAIGPIGTAAAVVLAMTSHAGPLVVDRSKLECVVENAEDYLQLKDDPVLIFMDFCPEASVSTDALMHQATNSTLPIFSTTEDKAPVKVIPLQKSQLTCLVANASTLGVFDKARKYIELPDDLCYYEPR